jgi:hypothetical protein
MNFSKETMTILKNFSGINQNILLKKGNVLKTISPQKNVMASVTIPDEIPTDFYIYDLSEFLGALSLFETPDVEINSKTAVISQGSDCINFNAADPAVLLLPPDKNIAFPNPDVTFEMTSANLVKIIRTASVLKANELSITGEDGVLKLIVGDSKNSASNTFRITLGETHMNFRANIKIENLKMITQDYTVCISSKKISRWVSKTGDMTIFVALEATSQF